MTTQPPSADFRHPLPKDLRTVLNSHKDIHNIWETLTPLARNEWICWLTFVKKKETRTAHLVRLCSDIRSGKRRPCCWPGCPHRRPKAQKFFDRPPKTPSHR